MSATAVFELLACILSLIAAVFIFDQHLTRPRPYKLLWTLGLLFYGVAAGAAFAGEIAHWSVLAYKTWYFFGGVLTAAFLGLGSLWLQAPRRVSQVIVALAVLVALYAGVRILLLPISASQASQLATLPTSKVTDVSHFSIMPADLRICAAVMNIAGTLFLFGGAVWSAWSFYRRHAPGYRVLSMVLLALGAVFPSTLTGLQALGFTAAAPLGEFLGAGFILVGMLISLDVFAVFRIPFTHVVLRERRPAPVASQAQSQ